MSKRKIRNNLFKVCASSATILAPLATVLGVTLASTSSSPSPFTLQLSHNLSLNTPTTVTVSPHVKNFDPALGNFEVYANDQFIPLDTNDKWSDTIALQSLSPTSISLTLLSDASSCQIKYFYNHQFQTQEDWNFTDTVTDFNIKVEVPNNSQTYLDRLHKELIISATYKDGTPGLDTDVKFHYQSTLPDVSSIYDAFQVAEQPGTATLTLLDAYTVTANSKLIITCEDSKGGKYIANISIFPWVEPKITIDGTTGQLGPRNSYTLDFGSTPEEAYAGKNYLCGWRILSQDGTIQNIDEYNDEVYIDNTSISDGTFGTGLNWAFRSSGTSTPSSAQVMKNGGTITSFSGVANDNLWIVSNQSEWPYPFFKSAYLQAVLYLKDPNNNTIVKVTESNMLNITWNQDPLTLNEDTKNKDDLIEVEDSSSSNFACKPYTSIWSDSTNDNFFIYKFSKLVGTGTHCDENGKYTNDYLTRKNGDDKDFSWTEPLSYDENTNTLSLSVNLKNQWSVKQTDPDKQELTPRSTVVSVIINVFRVIDHTSGDCENTPLTSFPINFTLLNGARVFKCPNNENLDIFEDVEKAYEPSGETIPPPEQYELYIPKDVKTITRSQAFTDRNYLVERMTYLSFARNSQITTIGASGSTLGAFSGYGNLKNIDFSNATNLTTINDYAFYGTYTSTTTGEGYTPNLIFPASLTYIGPHAFSFENTITDITLAQLTFTPIYDDNNEIKATLTVAESAFANRAAITTIFNGECIHTFGKSAFANCAGLSYLNFNTRTIPTDPNDTAYGVEFYQDAFAHCNSLTSINLSNCKKINFNSASAGVSYFSNNLDSAYNVNFSFQLPTNNEAVKYNDQKVTWGSNLNFINDRSHPQVLSIPSAIIHWSYLQLPSAAFSNSASHLGSNIINLALIGAEELSNYSTAFANLNLLKLIGGAPYNIPCADKIKTIYFDNCNLSQVTTLFLSSPININTFIFKYDRTDAAKDDSDYANKFASNFGFTDNWGRNGFLKNYSYHNPLNFIIQCDVGKDDGGIDPKRAFNYIINNQLTNIYIGYTTEEEGKTKDYSTHVIPNTLNFQVEWWPIQE